MKQSIVWNFRGIMLGSLLSCLLFCNVGCGVRQKDQTEDVSQVATGAAVYVDGQQDSEAVQHQLELLAKNAGKWRVEGDADENADFDIGYAVTDLDHNGRLEIMVFNYDWELDEEDDYFLEKCFEVNSSGDGLQAVETEQIQGVCLGDGEGMEILDRAYYDSKTGEYHYVIGDGYCYSDWEDDEDIDDRYEWKNYKNIIALTLKDGQITKNTLGSFEYDERLDRKVGEKENRYFRVDAQGKTEITMEEYTVEKLGDLSYANCGKLNVRFSAFQFEHSLEEMTEKQMYHALEKSYGGIFSGYPLEKQKKKIYGYQIAVPQYSSIQDSEKQKRINQMICEQGKQSLSNAYDNLQNTEFDLHYAEITIKYAGRERVSLLLEARGYREGAASAGEHCDTITIDLEQEKILSGEDIIPQKYQELVEEEILDGCVWGFHGGNAYLKSLEGKKELFPTMAAEGWQDVKIYQTRDDVGVVIPVKYGLDAYVIYELWEDWEEEEGIAYSDVDWEEYQYKMFASEYQSLQDYMPVLTGGTEVTLMEEIWTEDNETVVERQNLTMNDWIDGIRENCDIEKQTLGSVCICDLTQDGTSELILWFNGDFALYLVLHR